MGTSFELSPTEAHLRIRCGPAHGGSAAGRSVYGSAIDNPRLFDKEWNAKPWVVGSFKASH